ncbi:Amine sulfotransferase [Holothuria leucospilota]|uniref:Amine sulfotransferase n=1 Tax=Holothuria leucospilota TaxID=206669 RepID=A0A9Q1BGF1_HOLLE|nr:Amine sulfotransferase [Holothuria leucospilota]
MAERVVNVIKFTTYKEKYHVPRFALPEFIQELEDMEVRKDDIFVVTYPKSGTHWMQEIVHLIHVDGHASKLSASERPLVIEIADIASPTPELLAASGPTLRKLINAPSPRVLTTHIQHPLLPKQVREKGCKVIYVYRHPKDVIASDYNFCRKLLQQECGIVAPDTPENFDDFFKKAVAGKIAYGSWMDHVLQYSKETDNENFFFVSFEAMKANLGSVVTKVASFIGHPLDDEAVTRVVQGASVEAMRSSFTKDKEKKRQEENNQKFDPTIFINKGKVSQWKDRFTAEQNEYFDKLFEERMEYCDLVKGYRHKGGATH